MLEYVPSHPLSVNPTGCITRRLDDDMRFILESDFNDREKVVLYNQVILRYKRDEAFSVYFFIMNKLDQVDNC